MLTWAKLRDGRRDGTSAYSGNHWHLAESAHVSYLPKQLFRARTTAFVNLQSLTGPSDNMVPSDSRGFPAVPSKFLRYFGIGILYHHIAGCIRRFVPVENL